jgi:thiol-disulfide isomerase/thioredoxin
MNRLRMLTLGLGTLALGGGALVAAEVTPPMLTAQAGPVVPQQSGSQQSGPQQTAPQIVAQAKTALAPTLQGKPVVVDIYASWCPACRTIAPTLSQVKQQYAGKAHFVVFNVSDRSSTRAAQQRAKQLGLSSFLQANQSQTSLVAIINPTTGAVIQSFRGNGKLQDYQVALNRAIQQVR